MGKALNIKKLLHYTGVDPQTGLYTFEDRNKDAATSTNPGENDDRYDYNLDPKFFGGLGMDFSYKSIQLNLFFNIKKQLGFNTTSQGGGYPGGLSNMPTVLLKEKRWQKPR